MLILKTYHIRNYFPVLISFSAEAEIEKLDSLIMNILHLKGNLLMTPFCYMKLKILWLY